MDSVAQSYTDGSYANRNPAFGDENSRWKVSNALRAIEEWKIPHESVVEIGCGAGAIIRDLSDELGCLCAVGYEPMPEAYAVAKERETETLSFRNQTVDEPVPEPFDLAMCFDVLEHVEDAHSFVRKMKSFSSRFLFHIPLDMNVQMVARMKPIMTVRESVGHLHYFSKDTALAMLRECGLQIEGCFYTFGGESAYQAPLYRLMKGPRKLAYAINRDLAVRWMGGWSLLVYATDANAGQ